MANKDVGKIKLFRKFVPWIKVPPLDAELNSELNGVVFMDGRYLVKNFLANKSFVRASFTPIKTIIIEAFKILQLPELYRMFSVKLKVKKNAVMNKLNNESYIFWFYSLVFEKNLNWDFLKLMMQTRIRWIWTFMLLIFLFEVPQQEN